MHVFVESNFLLELAFQQEDYLACEQIVAGARAGHYTLHVPQYALAEVFEVLRRKRQDRTEYQEYVLKEIEQSRREATSDPATADELTRLLSDLLTGRTLAQSSRVFALVAQLAEHAPGPALTATVAAEAEAAQTTHRLSVQDALVWASVLQGLRELPPEAPKRLVARNDSDFNKPSTRQELTAVGCKLISSFSGAAAQLKHTTGR